MGKDSCEDRSSHSVKHVLKKKKKERKRKKHKKPKPSSSSSSESSDNAWVEKDQNNERDSSIPKTPASSLQRDEWMNITNLFPCVSRGQLRAAKETSSKALEEEARKKLLDQPGQSGRELNPYWADGGTGLPPEAQGKSGTSASQTSSISIGNSDYYKRALRRAKEQAETEGQSLEEVAAERWGSLDKLESLLAEAVKRESCRTEGKDRRDDNNRYDDRRYGRSGRSQDDRRHVDRDERSRPRFQRPDMDDHDKREDLPASSKLLFEKRDNSNAPRVGSHYRNTPSGSGNWRKKTVDDVKKSIPCVKERKESLPSASSSSSSDADCEEEEPTPLLTDAQLNELAAKLVKAEILGNDSLVAELKGKLQSAREARKSQPAAAAQMDKQAHSKKEDVVVLSRTDSKGFSRPLEMKAAYAEPYGGRRRKQKVDTHSADGQRARYFPDDDKYSLQEMFQKEKLTTVEDDMAMFAKLAGKDKRQEHHLDMDDIFAERARESASDGKMEAKERDRAIREHQRLTKVLDNCHWCFDDKSSVRNRIISIGSVSYVCLPSHQSLTDGHCLVAPIRHVPCATQLDEDVWQEMQDFRRALVKMFADCGDDCIWFESAMHLNRQPHMVWHCVPLPRESGDLAPIYFKKAILECETEWSSNKKLVELAGRDVRKAVPKGLPYFAVDFGMQSGFAHVIEDEKLFPTNFAQEIIGGMLELDHNLWRKPRRENFEVLTRKVNAFIKKWTPYDITKKDKELKKERRKRRRSRSSSSPSSA